MNAYLQLHTWMAIVKRNSKGHYLHNKQQRHCEIIVKFIPITNKMTQVISPYLKITTNIRNYLFIYFLFEQK